MKRKNINKINTINSINSINKIKMINKKHIKIKKSFSPYEKGVRNKSTTKCNNRQNNSKKVHGILPKKFNKQIRQSRKINKEILGVAKKMNNDLFEDVVYALGKNQTEGEVEKSLVLPLLKKIGYKEKNIHSKVRVKVKVGSGKYQDIECDFVAEDKILPTLVIEAKSPKRGLKLPEDYNQGMSYCFSSKIKTRFLFLTSGYSNRLYEADKLIFEYDLKNVLANIEKIKDFLLGKEVEKEISPTAQDIEKFFQFSHNRMYGEDAIKPAEVLQILTKLMLIKTSEERGKNLYNLRSILEFEEEYNKTSSEKKKKQIESSIFKYISNCLNNVETGLLYPEEKFISRNISINTLFEIVKKLYNYTLDYIPVERKGSAFDAFLNRTIKGKGLGQFFTHRNIVNFMVEMANLKLRDKVIDPACGTGGFIEKAFTTLRKQLAGIFEEDTEDYISKLQNLRENQIFGIEKDGSIASLAKLSMSMNGDGHTTIYKGNGLTLTNDKVKEETFNTILTNPPFGSRSVVQVKDKLILSKFDLGKRYKFSTETNQYEETGSLLEGQDIGVLFLERSIKLLKQGGFLGIILHDGIFSNSTYGYIRQYIRKNCKILGLVKLTDETFKPYNDGGGTETTILFCKKEKEQKGDKCFFGIADHIGYKFKRNTIFDDKNDFPNLLESFNNKKRYGNSKWINLSGIRIYERIDPQFHCKTTNFGKHKFEELKELLKDKKLFTGYPFQSKYFGKGEFPLIKIKHLNNSLLNKEDLEIIPKKYYEECKSVKLQEGDILLAMDGKKEFRLAYIDKNVKNVAVNQRVAIIRVDKNKVSPAYVFFVLISKLGQKQLMKEKTQTATVAHLSPDIIKKVKIPLINNITIKQIEKNFNNFIMSKRDSEDIFKNIGKN